MILVNGKLPAIMNAKRKLHLRVDYSAHISRAQIADELIHHERSILQIHHLHIASLLVLPLNLPI